MTDHHTPKISRRRLVRGAGILGLGAAAAGADLLGPAPAHAATGFRISNGKLLDANGNNFVMRGINHPQTWFPHHTGSYAEISGLGANTVRVVLSNGKQFPGSKTGPQQVADVIRRCKENRLVCVLEVHDTTGYRDATNQPNGACSLNAAVDYWAEISSVVKGQERYVIINLGNEPYGNPSNGKVYDWTKDTEAVIRRMRNANFDHVLMVDAPNWGQDWSNTMREDGGRVLAADPAGNTMLSVHMYDVYDTGEKIRDYLDHFVRWHKWPLVIGEFGHELGGKNVNEGAIMDGAQSSGVGYIGWSYSGNGGSDAVLDIVKDFDPNRLTSWGSTLLNHPSGIKATSRRASIF